MKKSTDLLQGKGENEEQEWITVKGKHIPVGEKESKEEAVKKFVESHENKTNNAQKEKGEQIDEREQNSENLPKIDKNKPPPDEEARELKKVKKLVHNERKKEKKKLQLQNKINCLLNTKAVEFSIGNKILKIGFTANTIGKNLAKRFNSDTSGFYWKQKNIDKLPKILKNLKYDKTKVEIGKTSNSHKNVKEWHYLVGEYMVGNKIFKINANIADTGNEQFLYELAMKKKKEPTEK